MATTPIASLVACSWCGLLAERGPICDACGSPVAETSSRTTVLRVPEASQHNFRGAVPPSMQPVARTAISQQAAPARWLSLNQASVMSGVPERTLRAWVTSRTPEGAPVREGDSRFLLIRAPGLRLPEGLWMVDGPTPQLVPAADLARAASMSSVETPAPVAPTAPVPRPDVPATVVPVAPASPVTATAEQAAPPARRPALSDIYVAALLAEDALPETWGFDPSPDERKLFRRHKVLTTAGVVLGFAGVAELIDFLMSHLH